MIALCECGCGQSAPLAKYSHHAKGWTKGQPVRFVHGHNRRGPNYIGTTSAPLYFDSQRWYVKPRIGSKYYWYRIVAWDLLGRELREDEVVHHVNGDATDDRPENLRVLPRGDHSRLHVYNGDSFDGRGANYPRPAWIDEMAA